jgi:hypothetical protein
LALCVFGWPRLWLGMAAVLTRARCRRGQEPRRAKPVRSGASKSEARHMGREISVCCTVLLHRAY